MDNPVEELLARAGEGEQDGALVVERTATADEATIGEAGCELDDAVMLELKLLGNMLDGGLLVGAESLDGQHEFILLRLESGGLGGVATTTKKKSKLVTEFGKDLVLGCGDGKRVRG